MARHSMSALAAVLFLVLSGCSQPFLTTRPDGSAPGDAEISGKASGKRVHPPAAASHARRAAEESGLEGEASPDPDKPQDSTLDEALELCQVAQDYWQKGELDSALEALDQAYERILGVEGEDDPQTIQQKEDLRFTIAKRILEIYASRHIVVNGRYEAIPMTINHHVQAEIDSFTKGGEKNFFLSAYQRSGRYRSYIATQLIEAGLPEELSWLPLIESGFKPTALSPARALGLWQFIPSTGYKFGLSRDKFIDERLDPVKATRAAIEYLKELHQIFGDWSTVLAAYNCGEGRVLRVIRSQNVNYLDNFWDLYERLPRETARYVPRFLATLEIVRNPEKYGLEKAPVDPPMEFEVYWVNKQISLADVAKAIDEPIDTLQQLNPELRHQILPAEDYPLKVPVQKCDLLASKLEEISVCPAPRAEVAKAETAKAAPGARGPTPRVEEPAKTSYVYHTIRRGETLSTIAGKYSTSVTAVAKANNIGAKKKILAGQRLKIPSRGYAAATPPPLRPAAAKKAALKTHVVAKGDSLFNLAQRYGTTTRLIQDANQLRGTRLHIGQKLAIPARLPEQAAKDDLKTYRVRQKDSPIAIARLHNMELEEFLRINQLTPRSRIYPGQTVLVD